MTDKTDDKNLKYKTIEGVFQVKYFIDFYQRDYTWSYENVYALLEDIYHRYDLKYTPESETSVKFIVQTTSGITLILTSSINKTTKPVSLTDSKDFHL